MFDQMPPGTRVARGATAVLMKGLAGAPLALIYTMILARLVPPKEMGILAILTLFAAFISTLGGMGLTYASSKFIPEFIGGKKYGVALIVLKKIASIALISSSIITTIALIFSPSITSFLTHELSYTGITILAILVAFLTALFGILLSFVQAFQRMKEYAIVDFTRLNVGRFLGLALLAIGLGLSGLFYGMIFALLLAISIAIYMLMKHVKLIKKS